MVLGVSRLFPPTKRGCPDGDLKGLSVVFRCVLGEMYNRDPILPGGPNDDDQLGRIIAHCGPLNNGTMPGWADLPGYSGMEGYPWDKERAGTPILESANKWG